MTAISHHLQSQNLIPSGSTSFNSTCSGPKPYIRLGSLASFRQPGTLGGESCEYENICRRSMEDQRFLTFHSPPPISGAQLLNGSTYDDVQAFEWLGLIPKNLTDDHKIGP